MPHTKPAPFVIVRREGAPTTATNGATRLTCLDADGTVALRRGVRGALAAPAVEKILPQLNALAGELLQRSDMPAEEVAARLHAMQQACQPPEPEHLEWAFAELGDVRVYTDGVDVIVTRQDLRI